MKKGMILPLLLAAVISAGAGCGSSDSGADPAPQTQSQAQEAPSPEEGQLEAAKEVVEQFFDLGNKGEYSAMAKLCKEELADYFGYSDLKDGENITETNVKLSDSDVAVLTDVDGKTIIVRAADLTSEGSTVSCYISVKNDGKKYYIDDIAGYDPYDGGLTGAENFLDMKLRENSQHYLLLVMMSGLSAQPYGGKVEEPAPDGEYHNGDGSEFMEMTAKELELAIENGRYGDKTAADYMKYADSVDYALTVENGEISKGRIKVVMDGRECELTLPEEDNAGAAE